MHIVHCIVYKDFQDRLVNETLMCVRVRDERISKLNEEEDVGV